MYRFVVLYLKRFKDAILLPPDTKLEVRSSNSRTAARLVFPRYHLCWLVGFYVPVRWKGKPTKKELGGCGRRVCIHTRNCC